MRPSVKGSTVLMSRPTKASLARQSKIRSSILVSAATITNKLKSIQNQHQNKSEDDLRTIGLTKRTGTISKNPSLFKRPKVLNKLASIISSSSLDNSTTDGEKLKQVVSFIYRIFSLKDTIKYSL